jgi:outer membrane lipase/esterase
MVCVTGCSAPLQPDPVQSIFGVFMKFKVNGVRGAVTAGVAAVGLMACGGGTQIESFNPNEIIAMGDEASFIETDGTKYTVNGVVFDTATPPVGTVTCTANQIWVQQLGYSYGMGFTEGRCPGTGTAVVGIMLARPNFRVSDLTAQVNTFLGRPVSNRQLVTVMIGVNDIIDAANNAADPVAVVEAAGTQVGAEIVRITDRGAKVIVSTVPDVGLTPYAINLGSAKVAQLSELTARFNTRLRLKLQDVRDGGRAVGLVLADELVAAMVRFPASYGLTNTTQPACVTAALPNCSALSVEPAASGVSYAWLWADATRLGPNAHNRLGTLAVNRARSNPF